MNLMKVMFFIAITMGLSMTLTMRGIGQVEEQKTPHHSTELSSKGFEEKKLMPSKRLSRFMAEEKNPRAPDHCNKDEEVCYTYGGKNYTCCNNKCFDLTTDYNNCGACKHKCLHTQACCRGECVYLSLDKRHCGSCGNRCKEEEYCIFGMCNYSA